MREGFSESLYLDAGVLSPVSGEGRPFFLFNFCTVEQSIVKVKGVKMVNTGDTAFVLLSAGLVMLMTPGLAFFLWRHGPPKKCFRCFDAVFYSIMRFDAAVDLYRL